MIFTPTNRLNTHNFSNQFQYFYPFKSHPQHSHPSFYPFGSHPLPFGDLNFMYKNQIKSPLNVNFFIKLFTILETNKDLGLAIRVGGSCSCRV